MFKHYKLIYNHVFMKKYPEFEKAEPGSRFYVGAIINKDIQVVAKIYYFPDAYKFHGQHMGTMKYPNEKDYEIFFDEMYGIDLFFGSVNDKRKERIIVPLLAHELGHIVNGDLEKQSEYQDRIAYIQKGMVMPQEANADRFAVKEVGKNNFMRALEFQKKKRLETEEADTFGKMYSIKEIENRMKAMKKY